MKNFFKDLGVVIITGIGAITGFIMGMVSFRPENIEWKKDAKSNNKESE